MGNSSRNRRSTAELQKPVLWKGHSHKKEADRPAEHIAVQPVQQAAVSRNEVTRILQAKQ